MNFWLRLLKLWFLLGLGSPIACFGASSKLLGTGGVTQIEGSAGGGLVPWALISGLDSEMEIGGSAFYTRVSPNDFELTSAGVAIGLHNRAEMSYSRQTFDLGTTVPNESIRMDTFGAKVRVAGDAIFSANTWLPQVSIGAQYKHNRDFDLVPQLLGAKHADGFDFYIAATKVFLDGIGDRTTLLNATLRATRANQLGLLGFGGDRDSYSLQPELSGVVFVTDTLLLGAEYRCKPNNLNVFDEDDFADVFMAWLPYKSVSLIVAYADLGTIADKSKQRGLYGSLHIAF